MQYGTHFSIITKEVGGLQVVCKNPVGRLAVFSEAKNADISIRSMRFGNFVTKHEEPPEPNRRMFFISYLYDTLMEVPTINELSRKGYWVMAPQYHLVHPVKVDITSSVYMISNESREIYQVAGNNPKVYISEAALKYGLSKMRPNPDQDPDLCAKVFVNSFLHNELMQIPTEVDETFKGDKFKLVPQFHKIKSAGEDISIWNEGFDEP